MMSVVRKHLVMLLGVISKHCFHGSGWAKNPQQELWQPKSSPMKVMEAGPGAGIRITVEYSLRDAGG
jgi:hypothetical protein